MFRLSSILVVLAALVAGVHAADYRSIEPINGVAKMRGLGCFLQSNEVCGSKADCAWCNSSLWLVSGCYPQPISNKLPTRFFTCVNSSPPGGDDNEKADVVASPCDKQPEATCTTPECVW
eukprot:gene13520-19385_t